MNIPVPGIDPPPHTIEIQARGIHAAELRAEHPGITDQSILADWANLSDNIRDWFLAEAQRQFEARLATPAKPDDVDALTRKLTGLGADELRRQYAGPSIGEQRHPAGHCDRGGQPHLGPCIEPGTRTADTFTDEWPDEPGGLEPHHAAARQRTDDEQAVLTPRFATGGVVSGPATKGDDTVPARLTTCAYDSGGFLPPGLEAWRNDTGQPIPLDGKKPLPPGLTRVTLSEGSVPPELAAFYDANTLARVNTAQPPAGVVEGEVPRG